MNRRRVAAAGVAALTVAAGLTAYAVRPSAAPAPSGTGTTSVKAHLTGLQEVVPKLTGGSGTFHAAVTKASITYTLTYAGLSSSATAAHIHFGQRAVNGGVVAALCGGAKPACPAGGGTVTGTITAADIVGIATAGPTDQGLAAHDLVGAVSIMRSADAYVNVHSDRYPGGEIRGQVKP
jgi:hypothetical protein